MTQRNTPERADMLAARAAAQRSRFPRFTPVPSKRSMSTRGERTPSWLTKRHTASRIKDMAEAELAAFVAPKRQRRAA